MERHLEQSGGDATAPPSPCVGVVAFVNARPLDRYLPETLPNARIVRSTPSRLAQWLRDGRIDLGLIPVIELAAIAGSHCLGNACVACHGEVGSVRLLSRVGLESIRRLALDPASRTSNTLARILLAERHGASPSLTWGGIDDLRADPSVDAAVVIGDPALTSAFATDGIASIDLGQAWFEWTGLPFVFAAWVARGNVGHDHFASALNHARDMGLQCLEQIASEEAPRLATTPDVLFHYFSQQLRYHLGPAETEAISLFHKLAKQNMLLRQEPGRVS